MIAPRYTFDGQVFFYCCAQGYSHLSINLAEGFQELGIPFYSNINYWQLELDTEKYLFGNDPRVTPDNCSVVVLDKEWFVYNESLPENLFHPERKYITVYLDDMDGPKPSFASELNFDFVFRTHYDSKSSYPEYFRPWGFGISNRILRETSDIPNFQEKSRHLLVNFRNNQEALSVHNWWLLKIDQGMLKVNQGILIADYPLRKIVSHQIIPLIETILPVENSIDDYEHPPENSYDRWLSTKTGGRHYPNYYKRLKAAAACACFAGWMVPDFATGKSFVQWWDSWRFWESLAAGCVTFHVDFDKYGVQLPVMPENWKHYIGIDLDNPQSAINRIVSEPDLLADISIAGRQWAIDNYSPVPTALRFLQTLSGNSSMAQTSSNVGESLVILNLKEINLIVFPDWSATEELLYLDLAIAIKAVVTHPDKEGITLLINTSNISEEDADMVVSSVAMNLLMEEELDVSEEIQISLVGDLRRSQWDALLHRVQARISLERENELAIAQAKAQDLPCLITDRLCDRRAIQLESGTWIFQ